MGELPLVDVMIRTLRGDETDEYKDIVFVTIHEHRIEMYVATTKRKAKNLFAFLKSEGLFQPWNKNRPKLLKMLQKYGKATEEISMRFGGVIADDAALLGYVEKHFKQVLVLEQNSDQIRWTDEVIPLLTA
jgi:hypothetical protein